jgi:hypothetical protein
MDGFEDRNGCPDPDNDRDTILDGVDTCPLEPEDMNGVHDDDGCPEVDTDGDGLLDPRDTCPHEPEDRDRFQDEDGCPDPDNDADGILDVRDRCPLEPEVVNGFEDEDGCPDRSVITVTCAAIEIRDSHHGRCWFHRHRSHGSARGQQPDPHPGHLRRNALGAAGLDKHPNVELVKGDVRDAPPSTRPWRAGARRPPRLHRGRRHGAQEPRAHHGDRPRGHHERAARARGRAASSASSTSPPARSSALRVPRRRGDVTSLGAVGEARWTYAVSKLATEHLAHNYYKQFGLPTVRHPPLQHLRPGAGRRGRRPRLRVRALKNEPISIHNEGDQIRSWCYIDDIVDAIVLT